MKKKTILIWLIILSVFGILAMLQGVAEAIKLSLAYVIGFALVVTVHELGHMLAGRLAGLKVNVLYLGPCTFIHRDSRWTMKFKMQYHQLFFGAVTGIAIPQIHSPEEFQRTTRRWAALYLGGPVMSLIFAGFVTTLKLWLGTTRADDLDLFFVLTIAMSLGIGCVTLLLSDGLRAWQSLTNKTWQRLIVATNAMISDHVADEKTYEYLLNDSIEQLKDLREKKITDKDYFVQLLLLHHIFVHFLAGRLKQLPEIVHNSLEHLLTIKEDLIKQTMLKQISVNIFHSMIIYWAVYDNKAEEAKELYEYLTQKVKHTSSELQFSKARAEYVLGLANNHDYLMNRENISKFYAGERVYEMESYITNLANKNTFQG